MNVQFWNSNVPFDNIFWCFESKFENADVKFPWQTLSSERKKENIIKIIIYIIYEEWSKHNLNFSFSSLRIVLIMKIIKKFMFKKYEL